METTEATSLNYYLLGLKETVGPDELKKLIQDIVQTETVFELNAEQMKLVREKMDVLYGEIGARGLAFCSGRAAFKHLLSNQSRQLGFEEDDFRFLPGRIKLKKGLVLLAKWMESASHETIRVETLDQQWVFQVVNCLECKLGGMCDFTAGLLQEFMSWAGGGKFYRVNEATCQNRGHESCRFLIDQKPLE
jgi:predicted hydrocarbon binding protein